MLLSEKFAVGARKCCYIISTIRLAKNNDSEAYLLVENSETTAILPKLTL